MFFRISKPAYATSKGFTLVELLVVITIIGILMGMLLPAVGAARESARKVQCANNLNQLGKAVLQHEEAQGFYPTGGWGWHWVGNPDSGFGANQPGGWFYNILPGLEMNGLHDAGHYGDVNAHKQAMIKMARTPQPVMHCPSRRRSELYPAPTTLISHYGNDVNNTPDSTVARGDYAINAGDTDRAENNFPGANGPGPTSDPGVVTSPVWMGSEISNWPGTWTGISFICSTVRQQDVTDGASNTLMLGEKYIDMASYGTGVGAADNENIYVGFDNDLFRGTATILAQDRDGLVQTTNFGGVHNASANFVFCDGSVHAISYSVDPAIFKSLGNRSDGAAVDLSKL